MKRLALALLTVAQAAHAQLVLEEGQEYHSPQHFAIEVKFGAYSPNIDASPGLHGHPFSELFQAQDGTSVGQRPPGRLLTTVEFDWQIWHRFGSLGLAGSVGFMERTTHSFQYNMAGGGMSPCVVPDCTRSSDETALNVMPFTLEAVYRFDVLALRYRIPLVPYFKGGVGWYLWWITNGSGSLSSGLQKLPNGDTDNAIGATWGLVMHPGLALLLDILDPAAARVMDSEMGINHSYLFVEMHYAWITGFGSSTKMTLSDLTWNAGLAFEF